MRMDPAAEIGEFCQQPVGRYLVERQFLCWCLEPTLWGCIYWGRFSEDDAKRLARALDAELNPDIPPHGGLADLRRFEGADAHAHDVLVGYLASRATELRLRIARQALIRPTGMMGSLVAGFYEAHPPPYPVSIFRDPVDALVWLGRTDLVPLVAELDLLQAHARSVPPLVRAVRDRLRRQLQAPSLPAIARALGLSTRTLQRQLRETGTSFKQQVVIARIDAARTLLLDNDIKLTAVAAEVGCASLQHFSTLFRKMTGESPTAFRARARR